jgi:hypothetical protein
MVSNRKDGCLVMPVLTQSCGYRSLLHEAQAALAYDAFRSWLEMHFYQVVGQSMNCYASPLARYLSASVGAPFVVDQGGYGPQGTALAASLPAWASVFDGVVDRAYAGAPLTGEQALQVLDCLAPRSSLSRLLGGAG